MGILSNFEDRMSRIFEGAAGSVFRSPLAPVQIAKRAEKEMYRGKLVGAGRQYAPTLYNVLVSPQDDENLYGYYPTLVGEIATYLTSKAQDAGLVMDGTPLVRFIVDEGLKTGKFDVIAENVARPIIEKLRAEEMASYGIAPEPTREASARPQNAGYGAAVAGAVPAGIPVGGAAVAPLHDGLEEPPFRRSDYYIDDPLDEDSSQIPFRDPLSPSRPNSYGDNIIEEDFSDDAYHTPATMAFSDREGRNDALLIEVSGGRTYKLNGSRMVLGREDGADIIVRDASVSRAHAEFYREGAGWCVKDLGSTNGTHVNGNQITQAALRNGDILTMGVTKFEYREG